jgi:DNA-binding MarR family transcriptional regulator
MSYNLTEMKPDVKPSRKKTRVGAGAGYLVRDAHKAFSRCLASEISRYDISFKHYYYLLALFEEDQISQVELSERVGMNRATVTSVVDTMESQGLVKRVRDPDDRRKINVVLTAKGARLRRPLLESITDVQRTALKGIAERDLDKFRATIERIIQNLAARSPSRRAAARAVPGS